MEISKTFAGTEYNLRVEEGEMEVLRRAMEGEECGEAIVVTYVEEDMEDEVDACWLACVMGDFDACRRILRHGRETSVEMMLANAVKAYESGDEELADNIRVSLSADNGRYPVPPDELFEDRFDEAVIEYCISCGFCCSSIVGVELPATANQKCALFCQATTHLPLTLSTSPITEGSPLSEADISLMRLLTTPTTPPIYQAAFATHSERTERRNDLTWVGHVLYLAAHHVNDDFWRATVMTSAFWKYISQRDVPKDELTAVKDGRPVRYPSRLRRVISELFPVLSDVRQERLIEFVVDEKKKCGKVVVSGVLVDQVEEALKMIVEMSAEREAARGGDGVARCVDLFENAVKNSANLISPSVNAKLSLYAHYKQATVGDCDIPKPGMFEMEKKAKWDAWTNVKGMVSTDAKAKYIELVNSLS